MARIRTIKPEFWVDEKIVELSPWARLLFIGLWNFADDYGRMEYREKKIKMQIFPADSVEVSALLGEIRREKLIDVYIVDNKEYLQIANFAKHQKVDKRSPPKHPGMDGGSEIPPNSPESSEKIPLDQGRDQGRECGGNSSPTNLAESSAGPPEKPKPRKFKPPDADEVRDYCRERGNSVDPDRFVDFYSAKGWLVGKSPMRDWRAAVRTWERGDASTTTGPPGHDGTGYTGVEI